MRRISLAIAMVAAATLGIFGLMAHDSSQAVAQTAPTSSDQLVKTLASSPPGSSLPGPKMPAPTVTMTVPNACGVGGFVIVTIRVTNNSSDRELSGGYLTVVISAERMAKVLHYDEDLAPIAPGATVSRTYKVPTNKGAWSIRTTFEAPALAPTADCSCKRTGYCGPRLKVTKGAPAGPRTIGVPFWYTITVKNLGPGPAFSVVLTDRLPAGVTFVNPTPLTEGAYVRQLGTLAPGAKRTIKLLVRGDRSITNGPAPHCRVNTVRVRSDNFPDIKAWSGKCFVPTPQPQPNPTG